MTEIVSALRDLARLRRRTLTDRDIPRYLVVCTGYRTDDVLSVIHEIAETTRSFPEPSAIRIRLERRHAVTTRTRCGALDDPPPPTPAERVAVRRMTAAFLERHGIRLQRFDQVVET